MELGSSRYFRRAELLVHYDGAVRHALAALVGGSDEAVTAQEPPAYGGQAPVPDGAVEVSLQTQLTMSVGADGPGIEYLS